MSKFSNNVTRLLDSKKVPYQVFEVPPEKFGALQVAAILGIEEKLVYKTIVTRKESNQHYCLAIVPATAEVDLKLLAKAINEKKVSMTTQAEAEKVTHLLAGGISPLALLNKGFQMVVDSSCKALDLMFISAGQRGADIRLAPADLIRITNAIAAEISIPNESRVLG